MQFSQELTDLRRHPGYKKKRSVVEIPLTIKFSPPCYCMIHVISSNCSFSVRVREIRHLLVTQYDKARHESNHFAHRNVIILPLFHIKVEWWQRLLYMYRTRRSFCLMLCNKETGNCAIKWVHGGVSFHLLAKLRTILHFRHCYLGR